MFNLNVTLKFVANLDGYFTRSENSLKPAVVQLYETSLLKEGHQLVNEVLGEDIKAQHPDFLGMTLEMEDPRETGLDPETLAIRLSRAKF